MLRIFLAIISVVVLLLGFAGSAWYLTHPQSWNWRSLGVLLDGSEASSRDPVLADMNVVTPVREPVTVEASFVAPSPPNPPTSAARAATEAPDVTESIREEVAAAGCSLPDTVSVSGGRDSVLYSWRDEAGRLTVSDRPPRAPVIQLRTSNYWSDPDYFELDIEYRGANAIGEFRSELAQDATGIYKILSRLVGENYLRKVDLNIVIYPDRPSYVQYANTVLGRNMSSTGGFYSVANNEAVTFVHDQRDAMMQTARHESTHLIATGIFGLIPVWLHEGLAEYFSSLDIVGQSERVSVNEKALQRAREALAMGYPRRLRDFLALTPEQWRDTNESVNYAFAEGLVFFLMRDGDSRRVLSALLRETAADYCQQLDTSRILERLYPGGISRLEQDYSSWLRDGRPKAPHDF